MSDGDLVIAARDMLCDITPVRRDCGELCGAACCRDPQDGELMGMALFPGEKSLYAAKSDWYKLYFGMRGKSPLLVCSDACPRKERPLACRIFPLTPYGREGKLTVRIDPRARPLCPLYTSGKAGLAAEFVGAVTQAMNLLWQSETQRAFIEETSGKIDEYALAAELFAPGKQKSKGTCG
jgi:Fe-S-cluster containining protein